MKKKQFKTESKKLMNLMINSIYSNKEIFLRELISNASDAIDKLHYKSLTDTSIKLDNNLRIFIAIDKDKRTLTISDNGIGMTMEELENNLGVIAKSGSLDFKENNEKKENIDIIGQFGVGFYSSFMVASKVEVISKAYNSQEAYLWKSEGIDGYTITKAERETNGTDVIITIKEDEQEDYDKYLDQYQIQSLVKKYSDYITYPIQMDVEHQHLKNKKSDDEKDEYETVMETETINSLTPLWKRKKSKIKDEEYNTFYSDKFFDYEAPLTKIHTSAEGMISYDSLIFIPSHAPYDFYTKEYEKGLQLYANGVLIMEKCSDLVPDYFNFIKGVVDSPDLSLNISRETLQQNKVLKTIANSLEKKIIKELSKMRDNDRGTYEKFIKEFGNQLKYGIYQSYGMEKDKIQDLIMFTSSKEKKLVTLDEYVQNMKKNQKAIYYACGETIDKIEMLPKVEAIKSKYEVLYCSDYIDEFTLKVLQKYKDFDFINICTENVDIDTKEEKESLKKENEDFKDIFETMKKAIPEIKDIRLTNKLVNHPVCLSTEGEISIEMEKTLNQMPNSQNIAANKILEINKDHEIVAKLKKLYKKDKEELKDYTKLLYTFARLIEGLSIDNPTEISNLACKILAK